MTNVNIKKTIRTDKQSLVSVLDKGVSDTIND